MSIVSERLALFLLAVVAALAVLVAPWAAINRETGARSAVVLLPERVVDFTGRTDPVDLPAQGTVFVLTLVGLAGVGAGAAVRGRGRYLVWIAAGVVLVSGTLYGMNRFYAGVANARQQAFVNEVQRGLDNPRPTVDVAALEQVLAAAGERSLDENLAASADAGLVVRRLPYSNAGFGMSASWRWWWGCSPSCSACAGSRPRPAPSTGCCAAPRCPPSPSCWPCWPPPW